nr:chloramphenicol acetyltransferase-like domain-containing protein [Tanacetum cinerariifolium]
MYIKGDVSTIQHIDFIRMAVIGVSKLLKGCCMFPVKGMYFHILGKELSNGLKEINTDVDLAEFISIVCKTRTFALGDKPYSFFAPEGKPPRRGLNPRPLACGNNLPNSEIGYDEVSDVGEISLMALYGMDLEESRTGGKKGKKGDWTQKKGKADGVKIGSLKKGKAVNKGKGKVVETDSPSKKGKAVKKNNIKENCCTFKLWASLIQSKSSSQNKTLISHHTCSRNFYLSALVTYKWIAKQFAYKIVQGLTISNRNIIKCVRQCKRSKQMALFNHKGGLIENYIRLWDYRKQLLDTNPAASVHLHVENKDIGTLTVGVGLFTRGYAAYENDISESYHNAMGIARGTDDVVPNDAVQDVAYQTSYGDTSFINEKTLIEDSQANEIPTQQSKTRKSGKQLVEEAIATGVLKTASMKRRHNSFFSVVDFCKSNFLSMSLIFVKTPFMLFVVDYPSESACTPLLCSSHLIDLNKEVIELENELELDGDDDLPEVANPDNVAQEIRGKITCDSSVVLFCYEKRRNPTISRTNKSSRGNNAGKRISGRVTPDTATSDHANEAVEAAEGPRMLLDVPEFSFRMVVCRSRKPVLDTIMEDPIGTR